MWSKFILVTLLGLIGLVRKDAEVEAITAWTLDETPLQRERDLSSDSDTTDADEFILSLNFDGITGAMQRGVSMERAGMEPIEMSFELPSIHASNETETHVCKLNQSKLFAEELVAKYPEVMLMSGTCDDGRQVSINLHSGEVDSFSAFFTVPGSLDYVYVDNKKRLANKYTMYFKSKKRQSPSGTQPMKCAVEPSESKNRDLQAGTPAPTLSICKNAVPFTFDPALTNSTVVQASSTSDTLAATMICDTDPQGQPQAGWQVKTFTFTALTTGRYQFSTCPYSSSYDTLMTIKSGTCDGPQLLCADDTGINYCSSASLTIYAGTTVFVQIATWGSSNGPPPGLKLTVSYQYYKATTFRLAMAANLQFSAYFGNSIPSVLNAYASLMSRVNGLYSREFGVFMQFVANTDLLICTTAKSTSCSMLPNTQGSTILANAKKFFDARGVLESAYDIGHVVTTGSGGIAQLSSLCSPGNKAAGTTGLANPVGDAFAIDYVAHEMGHQFSGTHTFKDCNGLSDSNLDTSSAVEPASGTTIMAYAGICVYNTQNHSDAVFHPYSLVQIQRLITAVTAAGCGTSETDASRVRTQIVPDAQKQCTIPVGNYFQLSAESALLNEHPGLVEFYQWDTVNSQAVAWNDLTKGVFRSWKPTTSRSRYFPNLYYLTHNLQSSSPGILVERLPSSPATWVMRFVIRSLFNADATTPSFTAESSGDTATYDMTLNFINTMGPLKFSNPTRTQLAGSVNAGTQITFTWNVANTDTLSPNVVIMVAANGMPDVLSSFDYASDLKTLNWIVVGTVSNTGSATLTVPYVSDLVGSQQVNWMIRFSTSDQCFAFDYVGKGTIVQSAPGQFTESPVAPGAVPTRKPTGIPTPQPSRAPTNAPTNLPTLIPTPPTTISPTDTPTLPPQTASKCKATWSMKQASCASTRKYCGQFGIQMKYAGKGCQKGGRRDGGCQCASFCGYKCRAPCHRDSACYWVGNARRGVCHSKATNLPGFAIAKC